MEILIVGGGASGLMAALAASENEENRITIVERQSRIGRKLLCTGNGRCNLTNTGASLSNYHGQNSSFPSCALDNFPPSATLDFFRSLGLVCQEQYGGRVYPLSDSANSVLDVLRFACQARGIDIQTDTTITRAAFSNGTFYCFTDKRVFKSDRLIIACGGKAGGKVGGTDYGYRLLKAFGHHCTKLYPALVPIIVREEYPKSLKGIRADVEITLNGIHSRGELQFTENGISGPAAFDISREAAVNGGEISVDFLTGDIADILEMRRQNLPDMECANILNGIVHNRLSIVLVKYCNIKPSARVSSLTDNDIYALTKACRDFRLHVKDVGSFDNAQITVGGIDTSEFSEKNMESKLIPGLFACGEVLDVDADCGGYNLQWAWSSGYLAGKNV